MFKFEIRQAVCLICASRLEEGKTLYHYPDGSEGQVRYFKRREPFKWREDHILLHGRTWPRWAKGPRSMSIPDENVTVHKAHVTPCKYATISSGPEFLIQQQPEVDSPWWYLPVHAACYTMARKAMVAPGSKMTSLGDRWMTLERRCQQTMPGGLPGWLCLPRVPNNRPGEPIELGLGRYYTPPKVEQSIPKAIVNDCGWVSLGPNINCFSTDSACSGFWTLSKYGM